MNRITLKVVAGVAVVVVALGMAVAPSVARGPSLRLHDRVIAVAAPAVSATSGRGLAAVRLAVKLRNVGHRLLAVSASDFAVSSQGDIFGAQGWNRGRRAVKIG